MARKHAEVSGLAEYLADDEMDAIRLCREVVSHLNWRKPDAAPTLQSDPPSLDPEELLGLVGKDLGKPLEIREVIGRVVDGSRFEEFKPRYGTSMVCGWASIHGYPVGVLGNNGVIYPDSAQKAAHFVQLCNHIDVPLCFPEHHRLHGREGLRGRRDHQEGIADDQCGLELDRSAPHRHRRFLVRGRHLRHVGSGLRQSVHVLVAHGEDRRDGSEADRRRDGPGPPGSGRTPGHRVREEADAQIVAGHEAAHDKGSLALRATGAISDDGIIDPRDTRDVLGMCLSIVRNRPVEGAEGYGVFRL